ncbi:MAG: hypothetical protein MUO67_08550 [Anaerolineales bacterium]|nr:hypothetical protein [Anaerolineales bacterium]
MMRGERNVPGAAGAFAPEANYLSASNPLMDPRFKIPGGQPWNKTPLLPGKDTKEFEERPLTKPFQLPSAMVGNMGGMIAQAYPNSAALGGMMPMGNAGFFMGPQMGQGIPPGYVNKTVS